MVSTNVTVADADVLEAFALLQRYSLGLDQVAEGVLGQGPTDGLDLEVLHAVRAGEGVSPSELVPLLGTPRSTLARSLSRLRRRGLVERSTDDVDGRRAVLRPTSAGAACLAVFESALGDYLRDCGPVVKEVELLLGRDPERDRVRGRGLGIREVLDEIAAAGAAHRADALPVARAHGLAETADRFAVIRLALRDSRPSLLAGYLDLSPAGTTSLLDRLEAAGVVERRAGQWTADHRAVLVRLTPRGRAAAQALLAVFVRHQDRVLDAVGASLWLAAPPDSAAGPAS